jgi:acetyl-CoA C-acetyltransferase
VQIAATELGLRIDDSTRPLSVTGGLTFAGGPGNNYAAHAIATLVDRLREDPEALALASAVGWYLTKHAVGIYSGQPPGGSFMVLEPRIGRHARRVRSDYEGPAEVEAYTITYRRDGDPEAAIISALTPLKERVLVRTSDREVIDALLAGARSGSSVRIARDEHLVLVP